MVRRYNEGKAIDAVIRCIEERDRCRRGNDGYSPDDLRNTDENHRVDYVVTIGTHLFAFEHTGIEPFNKQIKMGKDNTALFAPIIQKFDKRPDSEFWTLWVPVHASEGLNRSTIPSVQQALTGWIETNVSSVPVIRYGERPIIDVTTSDVPFRFSLHRTTVPQNSGLSGRIDLRPYVDINIDTARQERLRDACNKKNPKLKNWKCRNNAYTVLVLEENDTSLTNTQVISDALSIVEKELTNLPDEVFLVTTAFDPWYVSCLRRPGATYYDKDERYHKINPEILAILTKG